METKSFLYFLAKTIALFTTVSLYAKNVDITYAVISTLSFICVFLFEWLLNQTLKQDKLITVTLVLSIIACFILGMNELFPLFMLLVMHLCDHIIIGNRFYQILTVVFLLSLFIFTPSSLSIIIAITLVILVLYLRIILYKLLKYKDFIMQQKETIDEKEKKLHDVKSLIKTLKYTASAEERNRIAARIHDQIGHGISGSIILLEAAMLVMKDNPEKASISINKAVTNLREGVDEIRKALREERVDRYRLGINDIQANLEEFKVNYNKEVHLVTSGDLEVITFEVWTCIHDNLKECLTNVLKHSNATEFKLSIEVFKKIIKVEYKDNGKSKDAFEKGLGLEAIEERTISAKGRCFFNKGENGFGITNIFTY